MRKLALTIVPLVLLACGREPLASHTNATPSLGASTAQPSYSATSASTNAPVAFPFEVTFDDINPCTGLVHTVTVSGTSYVQILDNGLISIHTDRTITTSPTGFAGHGTESFTWNSQLIRDMQSDILTNASGDRIKVQIVELLDLSSGTLRIEEGGVKCL